MKIFNLIGKDTKDSLSPYIHNFVFNVLSIKARYEALSIVSSADLDAVINRLRSGEINGVNVTNPYKIKIIQDIDFLDSPSKDIGAVNCLDLNDINKICGYNTDWIGFQRMLANLKIKLKNKKIKIIGYGGAAHAVKYALTDMGVSEISFYNRKKNGFNILELPETLNDEDLVINATPYHFIEKDSVILGKFKTKKLVWVDLLYTKLSTDKKNKIDKNRYFNGLDMLIHQALESIDIWFRKKLSENVDLNDLKLHLKEVIDA